MSKAFTREDDGGDDDDGQEPQLKLPEGTKNYITPAGAQRLRDELKQLVHTARPDLVKVITWAAGNGDRSENADYIYGKRRLREIDRRIRFLTKRLEAAEIVDPVAVKGDRVRFGATVTVRYEDDSEKKYSIVGIDETDVPRGRISWISPLGKALLNMRVGDVISFRSPKGEEDLEIIALDYLELI